MGAAGDTVRRTRSRTAAGLAAGYRPLPGIQDEMVDADGRIRPHWQRLVAALDGLGPEELARRFGVADRSLRDSGVFYRVYDDAGGGERPWPLAPVPLVISAAEWRQLSAELVQRASLIEGVLADAYGEGRLVASGALPAAVIAGNREFLRPLVGAKPAGGRFLRLYAVDLGRGPDGGWWALGDRTQAPSGAGYALENRVALSRALPEIFRTLDVERLASFFQSVRDTLTGLVRRDDVRVGVLTPGLHNETYFEHAYLARYLGFLLVEGGDLTVRGGDVYIRTVAGLKRVDVLWRRLDADFADPIELNPQSRLGVAGLVEAVRAGSVVIANALGSGLAEARALMGFLPALAEPVLGEPLKLPNVATWWCGQAAERAAVMRDLDRMVVAPAFAAQLAEVLDTGPVFGADLDAAARARLAEAISRRGADVVGQEVVRLSTMPVWTGTRLEPRPFILRVYLAATADGWVVMPGGFCRVSDRADARAVTMQEGGASADVWVLSDAPVEPVTLLPQPGGAAIRRSTGVLPSRAADNLFWLGRYLERAEVTVRLVRTLAGRHDAAEGGEPSLVGRVGEILVSWGAAAPGPARPGAAALAALRRRDLPGAVPALVAAATNAASTIRDRLSPDAWRALTELSALEARLPAAAAEGDAYEQANGILRSLAAFSGLAQENMNRLTGWRFLELGRRLERGIATCRFAATFGGPEMPTPALDLLLELADSQITYRTRYVGGLARLPVLDLVVLDANNPRSVAFQVDRVAEHLAVLPGRPADGQLSAAERAAARLATRLRTAEAGEVDEALVAYAQSALLGLSEEISLRFFTHRGLPAAIVEELG